jgi:hypothetical protein
MIGERVRVHFNLHSRRWSVTAMSGTCKGLVIAHVDRFALRDCTFKVSAAGRQRVLQRKQRMVHAWVEGFVVPPEDTVPAGAEEFTYNPYRCGAFTRRGSLEPIHSVGNAWFIDKKAYFGGDN